MQASEFKEVYKNIFFYVLSDLEDLIWTLIWLIFFSAKVSLPGSCVQIPAVV